MFCKITKKVEKKSIYRWEKISQQKSRLEVKSVFYPHINKAYCKIHKK